MEKLLSRDLQIRPFRNEDMSAVSDLEDRSFKDPFPPYFLAQLAEANAENFLVAVENGNVIGYAVVDNWTEHQHLVSIAVRAEYRRKGVGQDLLDNLIDRLREGVLGLELRKSNKAALEFYLKNGFVQTGVAHSYYADGEDAIQMERPILKKTEILASA